MLSHAAKSAARLEDSSVTKSKCRKDTKQNVSRSSLKEKHQARVVFVVPAGHSLWLRVGGNTKKRRIQRLWVYLTRCSNCNPETATMLRCWNRKFGQALKWERSFRQGIEIDCFIEGSSCIDGITTSNCSKPRTFKKTARAPCVHCGRPLELLRLEKSKQGPLVRHCSQHKRVTEVQLRHLNNMRHDNLCHDNCEAQSFAPGGLPVICPYSCVLPQCVFKTPQGLPAANLAQVICYCPPFWLTLSWARHQATKSLAATKVDDRDTFSCRHSCSRPFCQHVQPCSHLVSVWLRAPSKRTCVWEKGI